MPFNEHHKGVYSLNFNHSNFPTERGLNGTKIPLVSYGANEISKRYSVIPWPF
jgi:hypothetical protein